MASNSKLELGSLDDTLNRVPYALTLSDLSQPDQPLIYMNSAFCAMTGYPNTYLGKNCRFLQTDLENDTARAEIRAALAEDRRTQVILQNRRQNGEVFYNLLLLEPIDTLMRSRKIALGAQFELSPDEVSEIGPNANVAGETKRDLAFDVALNLRLNRRRIAAASAVQLLQSWLTLQSLRSQSEDA